ncbi:MAG: prohibitin family protein [Chloroflexi bacterium]|nr:prohibitin family protein [Chloroflexota bacterium]
MFWIIFTILMVLAFVASILIGGVVHRLSDQDKLKAKTAPPASTEEDDYLSARRKTDLDRLEDLANDKNLIAKVIGFGGPVAFGLLWMIVTFAMSFHQVPAGHVGVVYEFGGIVGQTGDGAQWVAPWRDVTNATVQVRSFAFTNNPGAVAKDVIVLGGGLDSFSIETQDVFINARLDIQVSPRDVQTLYRTVGSDYVNQLIPQRVAQAFKDVTVTYRTVDIAPNRDEIKDEVEERLDAELDQFSIDVVALLIESISFSEAFTQAIENKQIATQEAARAAELISKAENEALAEIARAEGVAGALVAEAQGKAEANRLITASINPLLVQWEAVQKLADNITIALLPSGEGIIIDPATLLSPPE